MVAPSGLAEPDRWDWEAMKLPVIGELLAKLGAASRAATAAAVRDTFVHKDLVDDEVIDAIWRPATRPDNVRATYELERSLDWRITQAALPWTRQPALVVWGAQDTVLPVAQAVANWVRGIQRAGYNPSSSYPDRVLAIANNYRSPGKTVSRNRTSSRPPKPTISAPSKSYRCVTKLQSCAIDSSITTPGISGSPGIWPRTQNSWSVMSLYPTQA